MAKEAKGLNAEEFARWWKETGENELRQILHWKWDPIGVSAAFPYAADEYDSYAPEIVSAIRNDASPNDIAQLLSDTEQKRMGLGDGSPERRLVLAEDIVAWFESSQERWTEFGPLRR